MSRTKNIFNRAVVLRALIGVFNQQANAGAGRHAIKQCRREFLPDPVRGAGREARGAGAASVEIAADRPPLTGCRAARHRRYTQAPARVIFAESGRERGLNCVFPAPSQLRYRCCHLRVLIFINVEMFTGREQLRFWSAYSRHRRRCQTPAVSEHIGYCSMESRHAVCRLHKIRTPSSDR